MHKYFLRAFATFMTASLLTVPAYAQTTGGTDQTAGTDTGIEKPVDIVSATINQVTASVEKKEALAKAEKKAKKQSAKKETAAVQTAQKETDAQPETQQAVAAQTETAAPETSSYTDTAAQVYADTAAETETAAETQAQTYAETAETAAETYAAETTADTEAETEAQTYASSSSGSSYSGTKLNSVNGTVEGPSGTETYYNLDMSGVVSNMKSMGVDGEYWVRDDGVKMYGDYVMVAADLATHPYGSIVDSSLGTAIVVDTGDFATGDSDQLDVAVEW